jgi:hypothetical protein
MLQVLCGIAEGDSPDRVMSVEPRLRALGLHDEEVAAILTALGANVPNFTGNAKSVMRLAFARTVASLCEDRPHTFAWDAAHCMDEDSFVILEDAWRRLPNVRVVFVFACRAGFSHPLEGLGSHTALDLQDLRPEDAERLISVQLGVERAPDELVRFVRDRAGGARRCTCRHDGRRQGRRDEAGRPGSRAPQDPARPRRLSRVASRGE